MGMNIKNDETYRLTQELAQLTGETLTGAVTEAVRQRLQRIKSKENTELADRLLRIGRDCAKRLKPPYSTVDHGDLLYDDKGLPK